MILGYEDDKKNTWPDQELKPETRNIETSVLNETSRLAEKYSFRMSPQQNSSMKIRKHKMQ